MKTIYKHIIVAIVIAATLIGCDLDQLPKDEVAPETFFTTEEELKLFTNSLYWIYPSTSLFLEGADNVGKQDLEDEIAGLRDASTGTGWDWGNLRKLNFFLDNSHKCSDEKVRMKYDAIARFFRVYFYFDKVKRFGDVPWYDKALKETDTEELYKARDSRQFVMDKMLEDIDFAILNLESKKKTYEVSKWAALALKSRFCLFEGTYRKYHGIADWERFLDASIAASTELITKGPYKVYKGAGTNVAYRDLFASINAQDVEVITARGYDATQQVFHYSNYYTMTSSYGRPGLEKQLVNSYLMADGSRFTDIVDYDKMFYYNEMQNRDPRLYQTVRGPGYKRIDGDKTLRPEFGYTSTGYQPIKHVCSAKYDMFTKNENDLVIYRISEILLNHVEAKAERGTLQPQDMEGANTISDIRDRVGMPHIDMAVANANPDPFLAAQYPLVSGANQGVILEIRRERRIELVMEGHRYYDMMRWKAGKQFERIFKGVYFPGPGKYDFDGDGVVDVWLYEKANKPSDAELKKVEQTLEINTNVILEHGTYGNVVINTNVKKKWDESKDYLFPIPLTEKIINDNLGQNPGWD